MFLIECLKLVKYGYGSKPRTPGENLFFLGMFIQTFLAAIHGYDL